MYRNCNAFVWTGDDQSWGLAPLEAMLFGKPIIISAGNGVSEVLNESVAMVIPPHNPQAIQRALEALMQDATHGEALGMRAQRFVKENFTFANTANELARLWQLND
jgi:glycosyltransferase involved in cell wall biosynthesis